MNHARTELVRRGDLVPSSVDMQLDDGRHSGGVLGKVRCSEKRGIPPRRRGVSAEKYGPDGCGLF
jgi:hypothetical protein